MKLYTPPGLSPEEACPYIPGEMSRHHFFIATDLSEKEFEFFLTQGFRKFGVYFFRPQCQNCQQCVPIRVNTHEFELSKSQKRVMKKNDDLSIRFTSLQYREEIYQLYLKHSKIRFDRDVSERPEGREEFIQTHFTPSVPSMLSEFYLGAELIAVGFLDLSSNGLSSVYFIYDPDYAKRSLGIYGVLKEIEWAKNNGKDFYYLGYTIAQNRFMNYKAQFHPHQVYDWNKKRWG
jgi:arginine-tRNA-protein transferase